MSEDPWEIAGFDQPVRPPQLEDEEHNPHGIIELMWQTPGWSDNVEAFAPELLNQCRQHAAVRAALLFSMEIARQSEMKLRLAADMLEVGRLQGEINGLSRFSATILDALRNAETPTQEPQDEDNELS